MSEAQVPYLVPDVISLPDDFDEGLAGIPEHLRGGIERYVHHGILPGEFLLACLHDSLTTAVSRAGPKVVSEIPNVVAFLVGYMPRDAWGSSDRVKRWAAMGGLIGRQI